MSCDFASRANWCFTVQRKRKRIGGFARTCFDAKSLDAPMPLWKKDSCTGKFPFLWFSWSIVKHPIAFFISRNNLFFFIYCRHLHEKHQKAKRLNCIFCEKMFISHKAYVAHRSKVHMQRKWTCKDCNDRFLTTQAFLAHRRQCHGDVKGLEQEVHEQQTLPPKPSAEPRVDTAIVKNQIQDEEKSGECPETDGGPEHNMETSGEDKGEKEGELDQEEQELLAILHSEGWTEPQSVSSIISCNFLIPLYFNRSQIVAFQHMLFDFFAIALTVPLFINRSYISNEHLFSG